MKPEQGKISSSQLMFLIAGLIQGSSLLVAFATKITKQNTWLVVLLGFAISLGLALIYVTLAQNFPEKNLIEINEIVYGKYLGNLISGLYIWFFFSIGSFNLRFVGDFSLTYLVPETPIIVILVMFAFICIWAVRSGIEVIGRLSGIFVIITLIEVITTSLLLIKQMKLTNFLPLFDLSLQDFIHGTHTMTSIPFGEIMIFLMIIPSVNKLNQVKSATLSGLCIGGFTVLFSTLRNTAVLGITATIMFSPSFEAVRLIDIAGVITRMEVLVASVLLITLFIKTSLLLYVTVLALAQLFRLRTYRPLVLPVCILMISFALLAFDSTMENALSAANDWPIVSIPFNFLFPLASLILIKIRRLHQGGGGK
ncbi:spore germination protein, amino acid permease [Desulfosporosinus acidiphilus SJ4]|uniref:Spore germination protein, amino acid permease n=1 Tax=Desulfosporosinus acidiphilus (strain DSM 22704 / JCM 16185 / SJ4) TaxID=646529 RepID=I4DB43_DESAJ|nr:endospore germination permease [Desulfosporosinus acidiphilus]AFM43017.1 spore germination protein, amino acid permease [Desulfosporosinus acidiphilus SJ4]